MKRKCAIIADRVLHTNYGATCWLPQQSLFFPQFFLFNNFRKHKQRFADFCFHRKDKTVQTLFTDTINHPPCL